ncbi:hypothetical protein F2P81_007447 [Scophthalmus maximus]|uniref:Uncharacterized protein n=1 Tax=Scophthalmus maximus TaxID=52904 RepID=A0A6A4TAM2_SCOMX|nr:hypothetical protein F2P81_007447 [Scophthalmus maximus]
MNARSNNFYSRGKNTFERNQNHKGQAGKWRNQDPNPLREEGLKQEMETLIRKCLSDAVKQLEPRRPPGPPDDPKGPDNNPPLA